jgi:hypothetical protein
MISSFLLAKVDGLIVVASFCWDAISAKEIDGIYGFSGLRIGEFDPEKSRKSCLFHSRKTAIAQRRRREVEEICDNVLTSSAKFCFLICSCD